VGGLFVKRVNVEREFPGGSRLLSLKIEDKILQEEDWGIGSVDHRSLLARLISLSFPTPYPFLVLFPKKFSNPLTDQ
jgi:hypothetical protein